MRPQRTFQIPDPHYLLTIHCPRFTINNNSFATFGMITLTDRFVESLSKLYEFYFYSAVHFIST